MASKMPEALSDALYEVQEWLAKIDSEVELHIDRDHIRDWWNVSATCSLCRKHGPNFCGFADVYFTDALLAAPKEMVVRSLKASIEASMGECVECDCIKAQTAAEVLEEAAVDPLDRVVDGLSVRECVEIYRVRQRDGHCVYTTLNGRPTRMAFAGYDLTPLQLDAARAAWSAELRAKVEAGKQEAFTVNVDDDRWEP